MNAVSEQVGRNRLNGTAHRPETAGRHLVARVPVAQLDQTVADVLRALPGQPYDSADAVYVVNHDQKLLGLIRLCELLGLAGATKLSEVMKPAPHVAAGEDQEHIAVLSIKYRLTAVPVVDGDGRLLGVVPARELIKILRREHIEDLHRLAGIMAR